MGKMCGIDNLLQDYLNTTLAADQERASRNQHRLVKQVHLCRVKGIVLQRRASEVMEEMRARVRRANGLLDLAKKLARLGDPLIDKVDELGRVKDTSEGRIADIAALLNSVKPIMATAMGVRLDQEIESMMRTSSLF